MNQKITIDKYSVQVIVDEFDKDKLMENILEKQEEVMRSNAKIIIDAIENLVEKDK